MTAADCAKLELRRQTILTELSTLSSSPNYSVDGQSVDHAGLRSSMLKDLEDINRALVICGGPIEVVTQGF
jgi:hypothetical protein